MFHCQKCLNHFVPGGLLNKISRGWTTTTTPIQSLSILHPLMSSVLLFRMAFTMWVEQRNVKSEASWCNGWSLKEWCTVLLKTSVKFSIQFNQLHYLLKITTFGKHDNNVHRSTIHAAVFEISVLSLYSLFGKALQHSAYWYSK